MTTAKISRCVRDDGIGLVVGFAYSHTVSIRAREIGVRICASTHTLSPHQFPQRDRQWFIDHQHVAQAGFDADENRFGFVGAVGDED